MRASRVLLICAVAGAVVATAAIALPARFTSPTQGPATRPGPADPAVDRHGNLDAAIASAQKRLTQLPGDWSTWAQLGSAYVQQARVTADPSYYPKAEGALQRSLTERPTDNWQALVGLGALANARHDFTAALDWGRKAEAINPYGGSVYGVIADALTQLGEYPAARDAVQKMLNVAPGVASFTRASYDREMHGQTAEARDALQRALAQASDPADVAFCRFYLGELAFNSGNPTEALTQYQAALTADPAYQMAYAGLGKAHAALGQTKDAISDYDRAVKALPLPNLLIEYGDVLASTGQQPQARAQYNLVSAEQALFAANGVADHLTTATYLADHGQPAEALTHAQVEWAARHSVLAADAMAWALHRNGRDTEALTYADTANSLGWRNATFLYHRGAIHQALGDREQAGADLSSALAINPHFDILQAPIARQLLTTVNGPA
jgi:tetratricopeptide (TPR) repeat protein